jgi:hypothetical protein
MSSPLWNSKTGLVFILSLLLVHLFNPKTIEEAVQEVITYMETPKYPQHEDEQYFNKRRFVRQVMRTEKDTSDWKTGKLNGKRPLTTQKEQLLLSF